MRLFRLLFIATLVADPVSAQQPRPSSPQNPPSSSEDQEKAKTDAETPHLDLPVSLDKIKEGLQQTPKLSLRALDERPTFRILIQERQKLDELLATLNFKSGPTPAGGVYAYEQQQRLWNPVDHPLMQPYAAFSQPELLTIVIENLAGKYLAGRALNAVSKWERERAEAAAREEVQRAIAEFCLAQPDRGADIKICSTPIQ